MSSRKDKNDDYEYDDGGLSDDQWSDDTVYNNDVYWDPVLKRRFKTRHEHDANASNRGTPEPSNEVPKAAGSDDSWGEPNISKNSRESPKDTSQPPRNDGKKKKSAPGNNEIAVAEERGRSVCDGDGSDKNDNFIDPATQYHYRSRTNNHGRDAQYENSNNTDTRGYGFDSRDTRQHSAAPPIFDNIMPNTSRYDQTAEPGVRRNEEPQARQPVEYRYDQHQQMGQAGYPPPNPHYGNYEPHHSTAPPQNQAPPYYHQGDILSREMSGMTIGRGDQRSRVPMEPSSLVEAEYEGWNRADLNKELKRIEERTRALKNVMHRNERIPKYLDCSDVAMITQSSRTVTQDNSIYRDNVPPSYVPTQPPHNYPQPQNSGIHQPQQPYQESRQPSAVYPPQQSQGHDMYATPSQQPQHHQYTVQPSYAPTQTYNYPQPQNSGSHQPQPQNQDYRQPSAVAYPSQQNQGHDVYATPSQQPQHQQYTVQPSYPAQTYNYPQPRNSGSLQPQPQYQDSRQPVGVAYPLQQTGPAVYATPQQPQHQQYTVPPSNIAMQPQNYPQNVGGYQPNQDSRHQVSTPQHNYGSADYQKPVYQSQPHQYSDQPARESYPPQQNSGYGVHSYQQTQPQQSTSTMAPAPQFQPSSVIPQFHNYPFEPQKLANHQQQYYQDSRQPSRQVSQTQQQYPVYPASTNYQQPPQHYVAVPPSQVAPQPYNYPYASQNYTNQQQNHHYQDSRQPSRQVSPTQQQYPAYSASANYPQPQQQSYAAVQYSYVPPQSHYSREDAEIASYTQQPMAAVQPPPQEMPQTSNTNQLPQHHQTSPEWSAAVPSDPIRAEATPSSGTDPAQPRYNKMGKLIIEPSEEVRQWHMKRRQEEKAEKAARVRESPAYSKRLIMIRPQRPRSFPKKFAVYHLGHIPKQQHGKDKTENPKDKKQAPQVLDPPTRRELRRGCAIKDEEEKKLSGILATQKRHRTRSNAENVEREDAMKLPASSMPRTRSRFVPAIKSNEEERTYTPKSSHATKRRGRVEKNEVTNASPMQKKTRRSDVEKEHTGSPGSSSSTRRRSTRRINSKKMAPNCQVDEDVWEKINPPPTPMNPREIVAQAAFRPKVDMSAQIAELDSSDEEFMSEYQQPQSPTEDNDMDEDYDELDLEELVNRASRRMGTRKS
ncbi:hypothetical protein PRIPAC_97364 [Pristionchus pacificus]|uniref:Uncharacterized protein n=1 Tax=Pristionchus pacificus TaxID=54126 RepID=A0A2A6D2C0_PRIPA|nr:hypothetical protein PRIPAC_97364 [Pristionchus pacificus]|eukprot:PDM84622.1 hypothetical protein PRIPAC_33645 [Pristionchus pacificus]